MQRLNRVGFGLIVLVVGIFANAWPAVSARARGVPDITREGLPNVQSQSALVFDLKTSEVLFERDADTVRPIASVSKLVGALVFHEECRLDPTTLHEMSKANREAAKGGDKSKLTTGWRYTLSDLLHAALMRSDNRALPALGEACGMDPKTYGEKMTQRVRKMGLVRTTFKEPNGLSADNVSTARELGVILKEVIKIKDLTDVMETKEFTIEGINKSGRAYPIKIRNTDRLLSKNLAQIIGGKTGYTDIARYCFAVAARTDAGREIGMIFLGGEGKHTRFADFTRVIRWLSPSTKLAKEDVPQKSKVSRPPEAAPELGPAPAVTETPTAAPAEAPKTEKVENLGW